MTLHEGLNFCISLTVAMTVSLSVARDFPVCCAPFASTGKARQPVRMECQPYRWNDKVFEGVTFVSGDKRAIVSGFDRQAQVIPVQCGRVALMNGRMLFGMLSLAAQRNAPENPYDPSDVLTIDKQKCQATWSREYDLPGKDRKARFLLTYTGTSDGRLLVDYDFGITPEEAAELTENPLMYASFYLKNAADAWVGFGDKRLVLADGDELIAKGKTARKIPGPKGEGSHIFNYKRDSDGCRWSIEMPAHIMRRVWAWESAGEVKNGQLVRWVQWYCDNFALFAKHNAAQTPVKGRYVIDFCETAVSKESHPAIGGIDFEGQDAVHYPVRPTHNLLMNGSFEQDFKGWQLSDWGDPRYSEAKIPRESLSSDAKFGKTSLLLCGTQKNIRPLHSAPMALEAGRKYVLSWWAKATHAKHAIGHRLVIRSVARSGKFYELKEDAIFKAFPYARVENDGEWHRFERTFEADAFGACVKILADVDAEANHLLIDGIQVALEGSSSEFGEDPYVGNLVSSSPYNDLKPGGEKSLALEIQSYTDKAGKLRVRIKDFYSKYIYDREFELKGDMRLPLGLAAGELGKGLFVVRMDYIVNAKQTWTDYTRFVIQEPLDGTHATAHFFANHPWYNRSSRAPHFMKKFVEWGWKSTQLQFSNNKVGFKDFVAEERRRQGIRNYFNCVALGIHRAYGRKLNEALPPDERLESLKIREWKNVTSNHLAFVEKIAYQHGVFR